MLLLLSPLTSALPVEALVLSPLWLGCPLAQSMLTPLVSSNSCSVPDLRAGIFLWSCVCRCKYTYLGHSVRMCANTCGGQRPWIFILQNPFTFLRQGLSLLTGGTVIRPDPAEEAPLDTHSAFSSIPSTTEGQPWKIIPPTVVPMLYPSNNQ